VQPEHRAHAGDQDGCQSFRLAGTTTSLTSGLPRRETWTQFLADLLAWPAMRTLGRSAVDQMPMTGLRFAFSLSATSLTGTWIAIVFTL
jgi:hypothetical protein